MTLFALEMDHDEHGYKHTTSNKTKEVASHLQYEYVPVPIGTVPGNTAHPPLVWLVRLLARNAWWWQRDLSLAVGADDDVADGSPWTLVS